MTNPNGYMYADYVDNSADIENNKKAKKEAKKKEKEKDASLAKPKKKLIAIILLLLVGHLGIHRFYTGKIFSGILFLLTQGVFGIGIIYDGFMLIIGHYKDGKGNPLQ